MKTLTKMNIKLLLRNKMVLLFLLAASLFSTLLLNQKSENSLYYGKENTQIITELPSADDKAVYLGDPSLFLVKVYDASNTALSEYLLEQLASNPLFSVCRADAPGLTLSEAKDLAEKDGFHDRAGIILYLKQDFDQMTVSGSPENGLQLYLVSDDPRAEMFIQTLSLLLLGIHQVEAQYPNDQAEALQVLQKNARNISSSIPALEDSKTESDLTNKQIDQKTRIGYVFAICTLSFLLCGMFVSNTVIEEKNNKVFLRLSLARATQFQYFLSKCCVLIFLSILQTVFLGICLTVQHTIGNLGINIWQFLFTIFLLGLILSIIGFVIGILLENTMASAYISFTIWSISSVLSGLLFSIENSNSFLKTISLLFPQKWFFDTCNDLLKGSTGSWPSLLSVTAAYLIICICIGTIGLKLRGNES